MQRTEPESGEEVVQGACLDDDQPAASMLERLQEQSDYPISAALSITERCPLACPHCYIGGHDREQELTAGEIAALLDELAGLGVFKLSITGGEPATRHDLVDIVRAAWERNFLLTLKTSGATLTRDALAALREGGLAKLNVSLYHTDPQRHDEFVGIDGAWQNTVDRCLQFAELGGVVSVNSVLMDWNAAAAEALGDLCREHGWGFLLDPKVTHRHDGGAGPAELRAAAGAMQETLERFADRIHAGPTPGPDESLCNAGQSSVYFTSTGDVWLCPAIPVSMGNIKERSFKEIWDDSPLRKQVRDTTWGRSPACLGCEHVGYCTRCPGESLLEHGDFQRASTVDCAAAAARHRAHEQTEKRRR